MPETVVSPGPDDIAVVGVGCRFPGRIRTPDQFWRALVDGVDVLRQVPAERWDQRFHSPDPATPGTMVADTGGFIEDIDRFDAAYFGISPREAAEMDPQQRILLEVAAEAMEDACVPRESWVDSRTSVHVGMLGADYLLLHTKATGPGGIDTYYASGKEASFAAGRIAYAFGLRGQSMTVSTACSSSLTAVHLASRALRAGEVDTALAGGVNALLSPELSIFMSKAQALSPTGRCKPFDAAADGIARGEGCVVVVLKRYADALRDGDQVHGVLLGSAVNHDGQSAGLTVPNAVAQQDLLRAALTAAGLDPGAVGYVEAHGTGTPLGDPLELSALAAVLGRGRDGGNPLLVGSLKANFGHLDATAGLAGLLKAMLVTRHRTVPGQIHLSEPTPVFDWATSGLHVSTATTPLRGPAVAGVSSFGLSGTNAHVVVASVDPPARTTPALDAHRRGTLLVSASTADGLRAAAADHAEALERGAADPAAHLAAAATRRTHSAHRLAVVTEDPREGLRAFLDDAEHPAVRVGEVAEAAPRVVFAFSGHGAQWPGVGMDLRQADPVFADALAEVADALRPHCGWDLVEVLADPDPATLRATDPGQPALFALQVALARLWRSWGVEPDAVVGHSMGEIAAACVAGALDLADAARLIVVRSRSLQRAAGTGGMATVELGADRVAEWLAARAPEVSVAAVNGPRSVVVSGPVDALRSAVRGLVDDGVDAVELSVEYPSHGPLMEPYAEQLRRDLADLRASVPKIPFASTVDPGARPLPLGADYWARNLREAVRFGPAVDALLADGDAAFVELGAHPVLSRALRGVLAHRGKRGPVVASLVRDAPGPQVLATARADLHVAGVPVDWSAVWGGPVAAAPLPPPRWADSRFWLPGVVRGAPAERPEPQRTATASAPAPADPRGLVHALLAELLGHPAGTRFPEGRGLVELGLNSVTAAEFATRLAEATGRAVDAADVLTQASVASVVAAITGEQPRTPAAAAAPAPAAAGAIAVIGMACRVPGADGVDEFWALLADGGITAGPVPPSRWAADDLVSRGASTTARGSFLSSVDTFDNGFFRVSAREARAMDPQQRLFSEVAWEALEHAGQRAPDLRESRTGVFVGLNTSDYQQIVIDGGDLDLYYGTGTTFSGAAGRLSYLLGLRGPSMAVDTACSSSLTAVHLACQSLRTGESDLAVAGGANVMATPTVFQVMSAAGALSRDGRCKTFDDDADGYGRGEGAGAVVLKRFDDAIRDGDRVLGVIRGTAVNQDGASGGLTVPNGAAQEAVIADALRMAGLPADDVDYAEAHGTGTPVGDAIELRALAAALRPRAARPLLVGSAKANVGHLEAAAGVIGLIKVLLALGRGTIPPHPGMRTPTRQVDWSRSPLRVPRTAQPWAAGDGPRTAGVSAFGFTGTNAHVVVQEPPPAPAVAPAEGPLVLAVSGASAQALAAALRSAGEWVARTPAAELPDLCWTSLTRRTHHEHRAVVVGADATALLAGLADPAATGIVPAGESRRLQLDLGPDAPAWSDAVDAVRPLLGSRTAAVTAAIAADLAGAGLDPAHPLGARLAAAALWRAVGVRPDAAAGGAAAAAWALGEITTDEAVRRFAAGDGPRRAADHHDGPVLELGGTVHDGDARPARGADITEVLAILHVRGVDVDWSWYGGPGRRVVSLPPYPWQRARHWIDARPREVEAPPPERSAGSELAERVRALPAADQVDAVLDPVLELTSEVLGGGDVDPDQGFFSIGMDSVLAVRLKRATERLLGAELPTTVLFECPTPRSFAEFIVAEFAGGSREPEGDGLAELSDAELAARVTAALAGPAPLAHDGVDR